MSIGWSLFIIVGTLGSLAACGYLLFANRSTSSEETTGHVHDGIEELDNPLPMWWVYMFVITIVFAVVYLIYYPGLGNIPGVGGWTSENQWRAEVERHDARFAPIYAELAALPLEELTANREARQVGRRLFLNNCATCHGSAGTGAFGFPDLTDGEWIWGDGYDAIEHTILNGRIAVMPLWGAALGDRGVADVTEHVLALAGREHDEAAAARGAEQYTLLCVTCHKADGSGDQQLGYPNLNNDTWLYGRTRDEIAFTIRYGRNGNMPAQADLLGADRSRILAAYVLSLQAQ